MDLIPYHVVGKPQYRSCICGIDDCKILSNQFRELKDVRGGFVAAPTANSKKTSLAAVKKKKLDRWLAHLQPAPGIVDRKADNRNRSKNAPATTRSVTEKASESRIFVAWHHFHPVAIVAYGVTEDSKGNKKYGLPDSIPRDFVRDKIGDGNGYSDVDQVEPGGDTKIALLLQPRPTV